MMMKGKEMEEKNGLRKKFVLHRGCEEESTGGEEKKKMWKK